MVKNNLVSVVLVLMCWFATAIYAHTLPVHIMNNTGYQVAGTIYYDTDTCKLCVSNKYSIAPHGQWWAAKRTAKLVGYITVHRDRFLGIGYQSPGTIHSEFEVVCISHDLLQVRSH